MRARNGLAAWWLVLLASGMAGCGPGDVTVDAAGNPDAEVIDGGLRDGAPADGWISPTCGDGVIDPGETCDDGDANSDELPDACRTTCLRPSCGDGVTDEGEQCDDGAAMGDTPGACRAGCRFAYCGDGILDPGETCDEGAANGDAAGGCRSWCEPGTCGDGVVDPGEACDDGVDNRDYEPGACRRGCTLPRCGDGVVDPGEVCDDGGFNDATRRGACRPSCTYGRCGDGVVDSGEACDEGVLNSDTDPSTCRTNCVVARCGDGVVDRGEACDEGVLNGDAPGRCRATCEQPRCGDRVVDPGEECDDGNAVNTDGCDVACRAASATYPPVRPPSCHAATTTLPPSNRESICAALARSRTIAEYRADPGVQLLDLAAGRSASTDECIRYYLPTCFPTSCPVIPVGTRLTVEACTALAERPLERICTDALAEACRGVLERECPAATPTSCANAAFRTQSLGLPGTRTACSSYVEAQCTAVARAACPSPTLENCDAWSLDPASFGGASCRWYAAQRCPDVLASCPTPSLARCSDLPTATATLSPVCARRLTAQCEGWEETYCPRDGVDVPPTVASCMTAYESLRVSTTSACQPWLEMTCRRLIEEARAAETASDGCQTQLVRDRGDFDYDVLDARARVGTYDCTPSERALVHPHDFFFSATPEERLAGDLALIAERRRLTPTGFASCEEYVDERFWSYQAFRTYARAAMGHDARRAMQLAYATAPEYADVAIATRAMLPDTLGLGAFPSHSPRLSDPGRAYALNPGDTGGTAPRNDFHQLLTDGNADALAAFVDVGDRAGTAFERTARNARNRRIQNAMQRTNAYWTFEPRLGPNDGWHWHANVSAQLRAQGYGDVELSHLHQRRARFVESLTLRRLRAEALADARRSRRASPIVAQLEAQIATLDDEIEELLVDADRRGCFTERRDAAGRPIASPCDWAPPDFLEAVDDMFRRARTSALQRCRQFGARDLTSLASGYAYLEPAMPSPVWRTESADPTRSVTAFDTYLERRRQTVRLLPAGFGGDDPVRRPLFGDRYDAGDTYGNPSRIASRWHSTLGWVIDVPRETTGLCGLDARADGELGVSVFVFDNEISMLRTGFRASAREPSPGARRFDSYFEVLGVDLWDENLPTTAGTPAPGFPDTLYTFNVVYEDTPALAERRPSFPVPVFSIAGVSIVATVGVAGQVGTNVGGEARVAVSSDAGGCGPGIDVGLTAGVRPFASLDGFAELGVDLLLVELGVGADLRVLGIGLPITARIGARTSGPLESLGRARLDAQIGARLDVDSLSGGIYFYIDPLIGDRWRHTFISWGGSEWTLPIFDKSFSYELAPLLEYCALPGVSCD